MNRLFGRLGWSVVAAAGAAPRGHCARPRRAHQQHLAGLAAACTYAIGYRFYAKFIAAKVMALDDRRATPAERLRNGHDFVPTNKWIVFGHHFAAIAGPGPLVGPTLAAQFGYLPGTLWIVIGAVLGGCVQDFVILFASMRRDGKSLGEMAKEEIGPVGGFTALLTVLLIMIILLAVMALVVVNALEGQPVGHVHHRGHHAHRRVHGAVPALLAAGQGARVLGDRLPAGRGGIFGGQAVAHSPTLGALVHLRRDDAGASASSSTASSPARCRCGCCSRRATTSAPS